MGAAIASAPEDNCSITRIMKVPEPGTLLLSALGLVFFSLNDICVIRDKGHRYIAKRTIAEPVSA